MSFDIALTGLEAANQNLNVTANNLANVGTTGFKGSRAEFANLFASTQQGVANTAIGNGVAVTEVAQQFTQGDIETTGNNLDMALSGNGFFTVSKGGALLYTRDGAFQVDSSNNVVTADGANLQVYPPLSNGSFNTGGLQDLTLTSTESAPQATTTASLAANLPADATPPANVATFDPADPDSYNKETSLTVYDSLGAAHTATMYFANTGAGAWNAYLSIDGNPVGAAGPPPAYAAQALSYDNTGTLTSPANGQIAFGAYTPATGAATMNINFSLLDTTQYGNAFGVTAVNQDGFTTGNLTGISIDATGVVQAQYTNGKSVALGQVALANFANPQGLQQQGDNEWIQTTNSGSPVMGVAQASGFGVIQSGSLEEANVDTTTELVNMITAQRNFQANAQMIQTNDQITQTIINLRQ